MLPAQRGITMSTSIEPLMFQHFIHLNWIYMLNANRSSNYTVKQFAGKCTAKVQDADTIYWVINGDWYDYTYESGYVTNRP